MRKTMAFEIWRSMVRLYCSAYWVFRCGSNSPNSRIGRKEAQSTQPLGPAGSGHGGDGVWWLTPAKGFGENGPTAGSLDCGTKGKLKLGAFREELPPKGGSALNCSRTSCSIGL